MFWGFWFCHLGTFCFEWSSEFIMFVALHFDNLQQSDETLNFTKEFMFWDFKYGCLFIFLIVQ